MMDVFDRLVDMFRAGRARFRVIEHAAEGRSDLVAAIRGTRPGQGAKAIVCAIPVDGDTQFVLAVVPGEAPVAEALTGCRIGAIPPVSFNDSVKLVVDGDFLERESEIAFNAGRLDRSIVIASADYRRVVAPLTGSIAK